ncbi:MAG: tRNA (adenosine(37)-N6)-dimethylallyltransferase MiaA [SAR324 cluster bacterium]|nr:tRNA (adenosine(37)-N6)-dimethylallyltransferase MiaA [SAR324 cluster bacterium]
MTPKIIAVVGPTASGKSELALYLAEQLGGEIICADSMQVYQHLDIGTAKPTASEQALVPHHQLNLVKPDGYYSAGRYEKETRGIIERLHQENKPIILVGGTGLYFRCLIFGICEVPDIPAEIKSQITEWHQEGLSICYQKLQQYDPESASKLSSNDTARILRALEVYLHTGKSIQHYQQNHGFKYKQYSVFSVGYWHKRVDLYQLINQRTHAMLQAGLIGEVQALLDKYPADLKSLQAIGYRQVIDFLQNRSTESEMVAAIQQKTRNYAKRQLTWFRKDPDIQWFPYGKQKEILLKVKDFLV